MATLEITLFGLPSLERDGLPLARFPSRKVKDLLAYLLLNRRSALPREHLADVLWGECDGEKARHCLNTALWRLRGVLQPVDSRPYLRIDAQSIGINPAADIRLDVAEFEAACSHAESAGARSPELQAEWSQAAIALYGGDLLTDCYEDWCLVERERLQRLYLRALVRLLAYHRRRHELDPAIDCARRILACDPLRETVHRELIQAYLDAGDHAAALRQYELCEETVRRELGTGLMPETRALVARLLRPAADAPRLLPSLASGPTGVHPMHPDQETATALSRVEEAVAMVQRAQAQLTAATALLETVKCQLSVSSSSRPALRAVVAMRATSA